MKLRDMGKKNVVFFIDENGLTNRIFYFVQQRWHHYYKVLAAVSFGESEEKKKYERNEQRAEFFTFSQTVLLSAYIVFDVADAAAVAAAARRWQWI